jgi:hypothetical protein
VLIVRPEDEILATEERKAQIAASVNAYRERQKTETGRKQTPLMLTDEDRDNMRLIKAKIKEVKNQGEAVSLALAEFVKKLD